MNQSKSWILRPIAWICTIIMMLVMEFIAALICRLGEGLILWLGELPTLAVVFLAIIFGGAGLSLFFYSATYLPMFLVSLSDKIYPSNHAFRYYFAGIYEIVICVLFALAAIGGLVSGGSMFWLYARCVWLIIASIVMMVTGRSEAIDRHHYNYGNVYSKLNQPQPKTDSYERLLKVLEIGSGLDGVDDVIAALSAFYVKKGKDIPRELYSDIAHLSEQEKRKNLLRITELGIGVTGIEPVTTRFIEFYQSNGIVFPDDLL